MLACCTQFACLWRLVVDLEGDAFDASIPSWMQAYGGHADITDPAALYLVALYWACMTTATVGYGDVVRGSRCTLGAGF